MLYKELQPLKLKLIELSEIPGSYKYRNGIRMNIQKCNTLLNDVAERAAPPVSEKVKAFKIAAKDLSVKFAKKDEKGNPLYTFNRTTFSNQFIIENMDEYNKEFDLLEKKHKKAIAILDEHEAKLIAFLDTECDFEFYHIKSEDLPEIMNINEEQFLIDNILYPHERELLKQSSS